jgi:hypothetical protein
MGCVPRSLGKVKLRARDDTEPGDQALQRLGHGLALGPGGWDDHVDSGVGHLGGEAGTGEALA